MPGIVNKNNKNNKNNTLVKIIFIKHITRIYKKTI